MNEFTHIIFGHEINGRVSDSDSLSQVSFVDLKTNDAWSRVFNFDKSVHILESDNDKALILAEHYQAKSMKGSKALLSIANTMIKIITFIESALKSVLGIFTGRGIIGILFVLMIVATMAIVSVYAFIIAAPFILISYCLKWHFGRKLKIELRLLQEATLTHLNATVS
ncbi:MAG: hypothetical protein JKY50_07870 [Oleispira sp.]|nr:hypothetical protein [Oleispira sp.]MBL4880215.1 hypothetical protein [Oleispira sp.]